MWKVTLETCCMRYISGLYVSSLNTNEGLIQCLWHYIVRLLTRSEGQTYSSSSSSMISRIFSPCLSSLLCISGTTIFPSFKSMVTASPLRMVPSRSL